MGDQRKNAEKLPKLYIVFFSIFPLVPILKNAETSHIPASISENPVPLYDGDFAKNLWTSQNIWTLPKFQILLEGHKNDKNLLLNLTFSNSLKISSNLCDFLKRSEQYHCHLSRF